MPVALNADRFPETEEGKFFKALMDRWPQGLWAVTPDGKVLAFDYHKAKPGESYAQGQRRWVDDTISMIRSAMKEAGPLNSREVKVRPDPFANRGRGVSGDGSVRLAVSVIALQAGRQDGPPVVDSIHLSVKQWAAFAPPESEPKVGQQWALPDEVAARFTPALSPMTDFIFSPTPADAKTAKMVAKVARVEGGVAVIRYLGKWETQHNRDGDPKYPIRTGSGGEGVGVFDTSKGKMTSLVWVLNGDYFNSPPSKPKPTAAVIEWSSSEKSFDGSGK